MCARVCVLFKGNKFLVGVPVGNNENAKSSQTATREAEEICEPWLIFDALNIKKRSTKRAKVLKLFKSATKKRVRQEALPFVHRECCAMHDVMVDVDPQDLKRRPRQSNAKPCRIHATKYKRSPSVLLRLC